jgi:hypothetical protein
VLLITALKFQVPGKGGFKLALALRFIINFKRGLWSRTKEDHGATQSPTPSLCKMPWLEKPAGNYWGLKTFSLAFFLQVNVVISHATSFSIASPRTQLSAARKKKLCIYIDGILGGGTYPAFFPNPVTLNVCVCVCVRADDCEIESILHTELKASHNSTFKSISPHTRDKSISSHTRFI